MSGKMKNGNGQLDGMSSQRGSVSVVLGAQWGDEGKGKLVDLLAENADIVARCQGGNNAGHTVVVGDQAYDFHLLPSGIIWPECVAVVGHGVVVNAPELFDEIEKNVAKGLTDWERRLKISGRAHLVFGFHQAVDGMQETEREGKKGKLGTTKKGIGPAYASKANRSGVRVADLVGDFEKFTERFNNLADIHCAQFPQLKVDKESELARYRVLADRLRPLVTETISYLREAVDIEGKNVLVEGANAAMLDIDIGSYPFVTSSNCSIGGVCTGLGFPPKYIGSVFGVVKAYTTRVGDGPFPTEQLNAIGADLQRIGREFGVTTGRPRRCGWLDIPLLHFTSTVNGYDAIALTKLDILDGFEEIRIGVEYVKDGLELTCYPECEQDYEGISVSYISMPGWQTPIVNCRSFSELPQQAKDYVAKIQELLQIPVRWIGVGPSRAAMIEVAL
jgi:adenylosuccinate synthase